MTFSLQVIGALLLDLVVGDPPGYPHPVRIIGRFCTRVEKLSRTALSRDLKAAGLMSVGIVLGTTLLLSIAVVSIAGRAGSFIQTIMAVLLLYTSIAAKDLLKESSRVYRCLVQNRPISECRRALGRIVGRDTGKLDDAALCRGCIETVSENYVDGILSPLFWGMAASGLEGLFDLNGLCWCSIGAMCYKSVNTMDSMFGYKNEKYLEFGRVAAKLDDMANFLPARIAGVVIVVSAAILQLDWREGWRIMLRDRLKHASPNGGHPEAAVAGALNIRLGGPLVYHGRIVEKAWLGDDRRPVSHEDILRTNRLVLVATLLGCFVLLLARNLIV